LIARQDTTRALSAPVRGPEPTIAPHAGRGITRLRNLVVAREAGQLYP
jgi:hypothetical protein